ncbi:hypothetical protein JCM5350_006171 [Sporobolomyces pararoseus]
MTLDDIVALIVGTDDQDVKETLLPALKKFEQSGTSGKGKGKDSAAATEQSGGASSSSSNGAAPSAPSTAAAPSFGLAGMLSDGKDPLEMLRPENSTVGYLHILVARLSVPQPDLNVLMPRVMDWSKNFEPNQARIAYDQVCQLLVRLGSIAQTLRNHQVHLEPFKTIVQRYAPTGTLTSFHPAFLRTVFSYRAYELAREVLYTDITDVDKVSFPIVYQDHLLYHYLAGTIVALLGDYVRASDLLEICVSAPGPAVSLIQLDAYKKLVLVQLLAYGKTLPLPKYTSSAAQNAYKSLLAPYNDYVVAFNSLDKTRLFAAKEKARESFTRDHNMGLVSLVEQSLRRRIISKLTQTWSTLSLGQLTKLLGMDEKDEAQVEAVEREVLGMVQSRELFATISDATNEGGVPGGRLSKIVTFSDDPEPYLSHETVKRVTSAIERAKKLDQTWSEEGEKMEQSKEFVTKVYQALQTGGAGLNNMGMGGMFSDEFDYGSSGGFGSIGRSGGAGASGGGDFDFVDETSDFGADDDDLEIIHNYQLFPRQGSSSISTSNAKSHLSSEAMKQSLLQLPNETLARIAHLCQQQDRRSTERLKSLRDGKTSQELVGTWGKLTPSLHELSRTCQKIRAVCAPLLFSTVQIERVTNPVFRRRIVPLYATHFRTVELDHSFDNAVPDSVLDALAVLSSLKGICEVTVNGRFIAGICPASSSDFPNWPCGTGEAAASLRVLLSRAERLQVLATGWTDIIARILSIPINLKTLELHKRSPFSPELVDPIVIERIGNLAHLRQLLLSGNWVNLLSDQLHQPIESLRSLTLHKNSPLNQANIEFISLFASKLEELRIEISGGAGENPESPPLFTSPFPRLRSLHLSNSAPSFLVSSPSHLPSLRYLSITTTDRLFAELIPKLQQSLLHLQSIECIELATSPTQRYSRIYARDEFVDESFGQESCRLQDVLNGRSILLDDFKGPGGEEEDEAEGEEDAGEKYIRRREIPLRDVLQFGLEMEKAVAKTGDVQRMEKLIQATRPLLMLKQFEED